MTGTKASFLAEKCVKANRVLTRFDYRGHGFSEGRFDEGSIGDWLADAAAILDNVTTGPQILVGSSMGGWIMLLLARLKPERIAGIVGIAAAPDFTEELVWKQLSPALQMEMREKGVIYEPTEYDIEPVPYTWRLVEEGRNHLLLNKPIEIRCPTRLIQGMQDKDVPWEWALRTGEWLAAQDVRITLIKDGDHRLSRPEDLELLWREIESIA